MMNRGEMNGTRTMYEVQKNGGYQGRKRDCHEEQDQDAQREMPRMRYDRMQDSG